MTVRRTLCGIVLGAGALLTAYGIYDQNQQWDEYCVKEPASCSFYHHGGRSLRTPPSTRNDAPGIDYCALSGLGLGLLAGLSLKSGRQ